MSLFRSNKLHNITSRFENLRQCLVPSSRKSTGQIKPRRLLIDPLEERQLLSLSPADWGDKMVNETVNENIQLTVQSESVAADNDGDFVVTWTRYDPVLKANGDPEIDPATGLPMSDGNIYARYFTDEVQRLTLPDEIVTNNSPGQYGTFSLTYGGNEVQKIAFSATYEPFTSFQDNIQSVVTFGFDRDGNGSVGPSETVTVNYSESDPLQFNASKIETSLQGIGGALSDVEVTPINPRVFLVNFGDQSMGQNQPKLTVEAVAFPSGFYPAVLTSTVREPIEIGPIVVSPTNADWTATSIEQSFMLLSETISIGPVFFPPLDGSRLDGDEGPYSSTAATRTPLPGVSVQPLVKSDGTLSLTEFDLTFDGATGASEGDSGKMDHPELVFSAVADDLGNSLIFSPQLDVETMKEPGAEFRVNPPEPDDPFTPFVDKTDQISPSVSMDVDGDFVITWQSDTPDWQSFGSISDIYAQQFAPVGVVAPSTPGLVAPGVLAVGETFRVNSQLNGVQAQPSVGMDAAGNFTIAWASTGQDLSFFNSIRGQRYNRDGEALGGEFMVNAEDTSIHLYPYVALSNEGNSVITWTTTDDEDYIVGNSYAAQVRGKVYDAQGGVLIGQYGLGGGGGSMAAFDSEENFLITWEVIGDRDGANSAPIGDGIGGTSVGVRAVLRELWDAQGNLSNRVIREEFRANSSVPDDPASATEQDDRPTWPGPQWRPDAGLDADGDLIIGFEGYGPEASEDVFTFATSTDPTGQFRRTLIDLFYQPEHADLLQYFNPATESLPISSSYQDSNSQFVFAASNLNVEGEIEQVMLRALNQGADKEQAGRIRALLEEVVGLLRGEANGVMFSSFDADPGLDPQAPVLNRLYSDNVINAQRDGVNQRYIIFVDQRTNSGSSFEIRIDHPFDNDGLETIMFNPVDYPNNGGVNPGLTRNLLENELQGMQETGQTWNTNGPDGGDPTGPYRGTVEVRTVQTGSGNFSSEITARQGTEWDYSSLIGPYDIVYEVTYIGEAHDLSFFTTRGNLSSSYGPVTPAPPSLITDPFRLPGIFQHTQGDSGTSQINASIAVEPDGDFVAVWTHDEEYTNDAFGSVDFWLDGSNQNIYFRRFDEALDQAGPRLADLVNTSGDRVASGDFIDGEVRHIVLTFDEQLMGGDPATNPDSVFNPRNFRILRGNVEIPMGVVKVEFGMNKAADLAGTSDGLGGTYDLSSVPTNKWEAVLTLDADGINGSEILPLRTGAYTIVPQAPAPGNGTSGLRDLAGNALGFTGYQPAGLNFSWNFVVRLTNPDVPISGGGGGSTLTNGTTHPETPGAVAMDADGDHVVVWTAYDTAVGHDRVYMRMLAADGSPADLIRVDASGNPVLDGLGNPIVIPNSAPVLPVTPLADFPEFADNIQRHGNVAMDDDGDFVITWTSYSGGDADIYARRFDSRGEIAGLDELGNVVFKSDATDTFRVNNYTDNQQKWSDVAMDLDGDFVVTWSSYGQEDNGQLGRGYGIYARQYDSTGQPLAPEFQVNVTTGGNQFSSSVAMGANAVTSANSSSANPDSAAGDFVIVWTSDQNGIGMDIVAREFSSDGSAKVGPRGGEIVMNDTREGDQTHPDVAMRLDGETYIVTWTDSAQDGSGNSVFAELSRAVPESFVSLTGTSIVNVHNLNLTVGRNFNISDIDIQLGVLTHLQLEDVTVELIHGGVTVLLFSDLPRRLVDGSRPSGNSMVATRFDQGADRRIIDSNGGSVPSYTGRFVPEGGGGVNLDNFNGINAGGVWTLRITDVQPQNNLTGQLGAILPDIGAWRLIIEDENGVANSFQVNSTQAGHQLYSAAAMDYQGNFTVTWSGKGTQPNQSDIDGYGVFYQRYDEFAARLGLETRANRDTAGDQWISSIASDAKGNFALVWTGTGTQPNSTEVYTYASVNDIPRPDAVGPVVTDVLFDGDRVASGDFLIPGNAGVTEMMVVFNENMSVVGGFDGLNSLLNVDNWFLTRNDSQIVGAISDVVFELNPITNKYEATITFDGNGVNFGTPPLQAGDYSLAIRDLIVDVSVLGNALDGNVDGIPGSSPFQLGLGGYRHQFYVSDAPQIGAEMRINPEATKAFEQRFTAAGGIGYAREESNRSVAVDHDGDFVVVWTSYGQDDAADSSGAGVYMRMYDRDNNPLTGEVSVNDSSALNGQEYIDGDQRNATVAMDADGEFVVVWESEGQDADGSWGIYGKRYNSVGVAQINPDWEMVQRLTFDTIGSTSGQYTLEIGDLTTDSIAFDSSDPAGSAAAIETAILNLATDTGVQYYPGVVVSVAHGTDPYAFDIRFAGVHAGEVHPTIVYIPDTVAAAVSVSDASDDRYVFHVNSEITGNQLNPAVGMDNFGNFAVAWATAGQDFSFFNDVYAQRYNRLGERQGLEFLVNTNDLPGTNPPPGGSFEINPAVAMAGFSGDFVVAWDLVTQQQNGAVLNSIIAARMFGSDGSAVAGEFRADTGPGSGGSDTTRIARNPQLAMDDQGGFIVVWESNSAVVVSGYDVYYQQFNASGGAMSSAQVNMAQFTDHQVNPSVAIDADGDFTITWNGNGSEPDPLNPNSTDLWTDSDNRGVFTRSYHASAPGVTPTPVTVQSRVNRTEVGYQEYSAIGMEPDGDRIVVWSGRGVGDHHGIFARRYDEATDTAGPLATELRQTDGRLIIGGRAISSPSNLVVVFDEDMWLSGVDSVENVDNWIISRDDVELDGGLVQVQFGLNKSFELGLPGAVPTNKWEAVLTVDGDPETAELTPLSPGQYTLTLLHPVPDVPETPQVEGHSGMRDAVGNPLQRTGLVPQGADATLPFTVGRGDDGPGGPGPGTPDTPVSDFPINGRTHPEAPGAVAVDSDGDYIVAWTADDPATGHDRVYARMFDANGAAASFVFPVTPDGFPADAQRFAQVAADDDGDFIITWTNFLNGDADIYARRFRADGTPMGNAFRANTWGTEESQTPTDQKWSGVAMDVDGDFIITWSSYSQEDQGQLGTGYGVYARRYDSFGQPLAPEFMANVTTEGNQQFSRVAMDSIGGFALAWVSDQNGVGTDIVVRSYWPDGSPQPTATGNGFLYGEVVANQTTDGNQTFPDITMSLDGSSFVVSWSGPDGSASGVFGRQFGRETVPNTVPRLARATDDIPPAGLEIAHVTNPPVPTTPLGIPDPGPTTRSYITFTESFTIADLDVRIDIDHPRVSDLIVTLISPAGYQDLSPPPFPFRPLPVPTPPPPAGTFVVLVDREPQDAAGTYLDGANFTGTIFDDEALIPIDADPTPRPPYTGRFQPVPDLLTQFDGQNIQGTWTLEISDARPGPYEDRPNQDDPYIPLVAALRGWSIDVGIGVRASGEVLVNTTVEGEQTYSSVAAADSGDFVVTWSGRGDQTSEVDQSGHGVFFQRFNAGFGRVGTETRVNQTTTGNQWIPSVGADADGNFVIAWTGEGVTPGTTQVFKFDSNSQISKADDLGPMVTDVFSDGARIFSGSVLGSSGTPVSELVFAFSEDLSVRGGDQGLDSVLNTMNWTLTRNGNNLVGGVESIDFVSNVVSGTRKYEATITFDGDSLSDGVSPLSDGNYTLTLHDSVHDFYKYDDTDPFFGGNALDGDFDGVPGTRLDGTGADGYEFKFGVAPGPRFGAEFRINDETQFEQRFSAAMGTGLGAEESTRSMAMDHDGDFAVVWTSYGQDDPLDPTGAGVYLRVFDRNDEPLTGEIQVNNFTQGHQRNAAVAMDADGDFVVVWESQGQDPDGSWGIYGRRYDAAGRAISGEFRINSNTANDQLNPAVAADIFGNFVVVWASKGQAYGFFNDVQAQRFDYDGQKIGSEFQVNQTTLSGTNLLPGSIELNPAVAMDLAGNFVVAWDQIVDQVNGAAVDSVIVARLFDSQGVPNLITPNEFQANDGTSFVGDPQHTAVPAGGGSPVESVARNPQAAMDQAGNFIIAWEAFQDNDVAGLAGPNSYGIYFQRFDATGTSEMGEDHQANLVITTVGTNITVPDPTINSDKFAFGQVNASLAMDADGDYAVVWNGNGAVPHPIDPDNQPTTNADLEGVWIRQFHAQDLEGVPEFVTVQSRVNMTSAGIQQFPTIAMQPDGDRLVVWSGAGVGDQNGIFARRYDEQSDTAGPRVSDVMTPAFDRIHDDDQVMVALPKLIVAFDEEMLDSGPNAISNPANFKLLQDGSDVLGMVESVTFGFNTVTNKWEAELTLDGDGATPGTSALPEGDYELVILNNVRDAVGNPLGRTMMNPDGIRFSRRFNVMAPATAETLVSMGAGTALTQSPQSVASDADGNTVTVWVKTTGILPGIYAKRSDAGTPFLVRSSSTATYPSVAMDGDGDFVVTWSEGGDVYAQRFDFLGNVLGAGRFIVNSETENVQQNSTVAMDVNGDFVITWQSFDQDGDGWGIYAQRYNPAGNPLGGQDEIQVLNLVGGPAGTFQLQWNDGNGNNISGIITIEAGGNSFSIVDQVTARLAEIGADVDVHAVSATEIAVRFTRSQGAKNQRPISVANSNIAGAAGSHVGMSTAIEGSSGEFLVNDTTDNNQISPAIAMDADGDFVISWTSAGQDGDNAFETNIYARQFPRNGVIRGATTLPTVEQMNLGSFDDPSASFLGIGRVSPSQLVVEPGNGLDGVGIVWADGGFGSGALLSSGVHVLTAAHVVTDPSFFAEPIPTPLISVQFFYPDPNGLGTIFETIPAKEVFVHPYWTYVIGAGYDIAIVELEWAPSLEVERYEIYRESDELGQPVEKAGFGTAGMGDFGDGGTTFVDFQLRSGLNRYDTTGSLMGSSDTDLFYDFDNGLGENDAFGVLHGIHDTGFGDQEISSAPGDSGGPAFIDGKIAGITSYGSDGANYTDGIGVFDVAPGSLFSYGDFGADTRVSVFADWIDTISLSGPEFMVNQTVANSQQWSSVAMDAEGDFVVTWTSYGHDGVGSGYGFGQNGLNGVFARRYAGSSPVSDEFQVNQFGEDNQQKSSVSMDADGDFVIAWESRGQDGDGYGIYAQRFARSQRMNETPLVDDQGNFVLDTNGLLIWVLADPLLGPAGQIGKELAINTTTAGNQSAPGVALDDTGDIAIAWSGNGPGSANGVFQRNFLKPEDEAGPTVTDIYNVMAGPALGQLLDDPVFDETVSQFVFAFGENLSVEGGENGFESVLNPNNWELTKDGEPFAGSILSIRFGLNQAFTDLGVAASGKYEAVVSFDGDPNAAGVQALARGKYVLTLRDNVEDVSSLNESGNMLDGDYDGLPGEDFTFQFNVFSGTTGSGGPSGPSDPLEDDTDTRVNVDVRQNQQSPVVASNAQGAHVVVYTRETPPDVGSLVPPTSTVASDVMAQVYDKFGQRQGPEILVASHIGGVQTDPDVAMDVFGNFTVTWAGNGVDDDSGVFARVFDAYGIPLRDQFRVNQTTDNAQYSPEIAADANGDFVVSWTSDGDNLAAANIYARRFNNQGQPLANEFMVNSTTGNSHQTSDVAMNVDGRFVVTWAAMAQDESSLGVFAQRYDSQGARLGGEFRVNSYGHDLQNDPQVAMDNAGNFTIVWSSFLQDRSGWGVYARRYNAAGADLSGELRVNQTSLNSQHQPAVSMDNGGRTVITWTSIDQEGGNTDDAGIFARIFNSNGSDYIDADGNVVGEFRINANTDGDQTDSAVAMDANGDFIVAWVGPDVLDPTNIGLPGLSTVMTGTGVFRRIVVLNPGDYQDNSQTVGVANAYTGRFVHAAGVSETSINGTAGDDLFEVIAGAAPGAWTVKLNGVVKDVVSGADSVEFNGMGGNDTVNLVSLAPGQDDSAELWHDHGTFTSGGVTFTLTDVDSVNIDAGAGADTVIIHDSPNDDLLVARAAVNPQVPGDIRISDTAGSYGHILANFEIMTAYSTEGGIDTAKLYDADSDDKFISEPDFSLLKGDDFSLRAKYFQFNHGYALNEGNDVAEFHDNPGLRDRFKGYSTYAKMSKGLYQRRAKGFESVVAYATAGDGDDARFFDSKENDQFDASPTVSRMFSQAAGYDITAMAFDTVLARANSGGFDTASFTGGPNDDLLLAKRVSGVSGQTSPKTVMMDRDTNGDVYEITARKFDMIYANGASEGWDIAKLWDTLGDDKFAADGDRATMHGPGDELLYDVMAFDQVNINRANGGNDTVQKGAAINFKLME